VTLLEQLRGLLEAAKPANDDPDDDGPSKLRAVV
jgi:hypothetical protein